MKKIFFRIVVLLVLVLGVLALKPINTSAENSVKVTGIVESVSEGGTKDLVIQLKDDSLSYYINRGLENGFQLQKAKNDLVGKEIKIFYAKSWTPLAPFGTTNKHITHCVANDTVLFSEWK